MYRHSSGVRRRISPYALKGWWGSDGQRYGRGMGEERRGERGKEEEEEKGRRRRQPRALPRWKVKRARVMTAEIQQEHTGDFQLAPNELESMMSQLSDSFLPERATGEAVDFTLDSIMADVGSSGSAGVSRLSGGAADEGAAHRRSQSIGPLGHSTPASHTPWPMAHDAPCTVQRAAMHAYGHNAGTLSGNEARGWAQARGNHGI